MSLLKTFSKMIIFKTKNNFVLFIKIIDKMKIKELI